MYHRAVNVTAFILAGGKSSRMGRDKALLDWGGATLMEHALSLCKAVSERVAIVGSAQHARFGPVLLDVYPGRGPLGGIHAALAASRTDLNLILAVDMPLVEPRFLLFMVERARQNGATVTIPRTTEGWQPLCAVYRRSFAGIARQALEQGRNKIDALFSEVMVDVLRESELISEGFSESMFRNLNTPQELDEARSVRQRGTRE
jgi:molybdopterin-guanine dinucleotide biosynthesis protein A